MIEFLVNERCHKRMTILSMSAMRVSVGVAKRALPCVIDLNYPGVCVFWLGGQSRTAGKVAYSNAGCSLRPLCIVSCCVCLFVCLVCFCFFNKPQGAAAVHRAANWLQSRFAL